MHRGKLSAFVALCCVLAGTPLLDAQDRLKSMPGNDQFEKMSKLIPASVKLGALNVTWKENSKAFEYAIDGTLHRYDIAERKSTNLGKTKVPAGPLPKGGGFKKGDSKGGGPKRGRQASSAMAPNGKLIVDPENWTTSRTRFFGVVIVVNQGDSNEQESAGAYARIQGPGGIGGMEG